jgi:hypothetical protein
MFVFRPHLSCLINGIVKHCITQHINDVMSDFISDRCLRIDLVQPIKVTINRNGVVSRIVRNWKFQGVPAALFCTLAIWNKNLIFSYTPVTLLEHNLKISQKLKLESLKRISNLKCLR